MWLQKPGSGGLEPAGITASALWGAGCSLLPLPIGHALSTAVYLMTFFYVFAFWPIQSLVERLFDRHRRREADAQKP